VVSWASFETSVARIVVSSLVFAACASFRVVPAVAPSAAGLLQQRLNRGSR
jgi:hypothetical protein